MANLTITGLGYLDGAYQFDDSRFTMRDFHTIKRIAGVRAGELNDALAAGDSDLMVAIAVIALERNGRTGVEEALWDADAAQINLELGDSDAGPPAQGLGDLKPSSGVDSTISSGHQETNQQLTGDQPSGTSAISDQEISPI